MEVISEHEAYEICQENGWKFIKCYSGRGENYGKLMMLADDGRIGSSRYYDDDFDIIIDEPTNNVVCTIYPYTNSILYIADSKFKVGKVTFNIGQAKKFTKEEADKKVFFMNRNKSSKYVWETKQVG